MVALIVHWLIGAGIFLGLPVLLIGSLLFSRCCMPRLDKAIRAEGQDHAGWDGAGLRLFSYMVALTFPPHNNPLINVYAVRRHARLRDYALAWLTLTAATLLLMAGVLNAHYQS